MYKHLVTFLLLVPVFVFSASNSCSHTVSIRIIPVDKIELSGGNVDFTFYSDKNESHSGKAVQTDRSCQLQWSIFSNERKITVESDQGDPDFQLSVKADRVSTGQSSGEVLLSAGDGARDFVTGVGHSQGSCYLNYKAVAELSPEQKIETRHITYTIVSE